MEIHILQGQQLFNKHVCVIFIVEDVLFKERRHYFGKAVIEYSLPSFSMVKFTVTNGGASVTLNSGSVAVGGNCTAFL